MNPQTRVGQWFAKAILGIERPGHKYVSRKPKAGGRYDYVYKEPQIADGASYRAEEAEKEGKLPLNAACSRLYREARIPRARAEVLLQAERQASRSTEWHHLGGLQRVDFYNWRAVADAVEERGEAATLADYNRRSAANKADDVRTAKIQHAIEDAATPDWENTKKVIKTLAAKEGDFRVQLAGSGDVVEKVGSRLRYNDVDIDLLIKGVWGQERPGHKYVRRVPKAGGRYDYVYKEPVGGKPVPQTETPQFKAWFGASKVVDKNGKPLVVFHGALPGKTQFTGREDKSNYIQGNVFFCDSPAVAKGYTPHRTDSFHAADELCEADGLYRVFLSVQKPLVVDAKGKDWLEIPYGKTGQIQIDDLAVLARRKGYDGLIVKDVFDQFGPCTQYVVFESSQIKSATGNSGAFDASNPDITKSVGAERPGHKYLTRFPLAGGGYKYVYTEPVNETPVHVEPVELATAMAARTNKEKAKNAAEQVKQYGEAQRYNLVPDTPEMHMNFATKFDGWMRTKSVAELRGYLVQRGNEDSWRYFKRFTGAEGSTIPEREAAVRAWVGDAVYDASVVREKEFRKEQHAKEAAAIEARSQATLLEEKETIGQYPFYEMDKKTVVPFREWVEHRYAEGYTQLTKWPIPARAGGPSGKFGYFLGNPTTRQMIQLSGAYRRYAECWLATKTAEK